MIFHATALSSYSAKVRVVLCVKGLDFEERAPAQGYRSPEYRALVPMGTLPAIQIEDWVLSESEVINEYLEERYPAPAMLPQDLEQRARVRFLCRFHDLHLEPKVRALFGQLKPAQRNPETVPNISLADCGFLVNVPLAAAVLAACGQSLTLPPVLAHWLSVASVHPPVERALAPWRAATLAWLSS